MFMRPVLAAPPLCVRRAPAVLSLATDTDAFTLSTVFPRQNLLKAPENYFDYLEPCVLGWIIQ